MKKVVFFSLAVFVSGIFGCDKVKNPLPKQFIDIDVNLLDGMSISDYKQSQWPDFQNNTNTKMNVLIEDYTGHLCNNCPKAAKKIHEIEQLFPERVFGAALHTGPRGDKGFQVTTGKYSHNFRNPLVVAISHWLPVNAEDFFGNPSVTINRKVNNGAIFQTLSNVATWEGQVSGLLNAPLKVNLQAKVNYFPNTRGIIVHTEVDPLVTLPEECYQVVYLLQDSFIAPQKLPSDWNQGTEDLEYEHKDVFRTCIDGLDRGRKLEDGMKIDKDGNKLTGDKYYLNYSYKLPTENNYDPEKMHLLIYVYDNATKEVLQVIKQKIK